MGIWSSVEAEGHNDWEPVIMAARLKENIKIREKRRDCEKKGSDGREGYLEVDREAERKRGRTRFHGEMAAAWILIRRRGEMEGGMDAARWRETEGARWR
jgi:hypothetical protein